MKAYSLTHLSEMDLPRILMQLMNLNLQNLRLLIYHKLVVISTCPRYNKKISNRSQCFKIQEWVGWVKLCLISRNLNKWLLIQIMICLLMRARVKFTRNKWSILATMEVSMLLKRWVTIRISNNKCHLRIMFRKDHECKHNNKWWCSNSKR